MNIYTPKPREIIEITDDMVFDLPIGPEEVKQEDLGR
jgi:hypothetical protein